MSEETKQDISKLSDSELTPEQLARRVKNREKKARQRLAKSKNIDNASTPPKANTKPNAPVRLSDEEYTKELIDKKTERVSRNPRAAVVSLAETNESRALAFKINEINMITDYTRSNMGGSKISFEDGAKLINMFKDEITANIEKFIELANSLGIGSRYSLREYEQSQKKIKSNEKRVNAMYEKSIANENAAETKDRENKDKVLEKVSNDLIKALEKVSELEKVKTEALAEVKSGFDERIKVQEQRAAEERAKAKEDIQDINNKEEDAKAS